MALFVYVDNSNLWIEGMRISAVKKGLASSPKDAMDRRVTDQFWSYDFGRLYTATCPDTAQIGRSSLFGSRPPENDSLWALAETAGFQVQVFDRSASNREKEVDSAITTLMLEESYEFMKGERHDRVVLVAGDRDYARRLIPLRGAASRPRLCSGGTRHRRTFRAKADSFVELDALHDFIGRTRNPGSDAALHVGTEE